MPVGSPGVDLEEIESIESKIDFTVIPGISAIESKIDLLGPSIITGISAIESKLDQLDLQHVDEMLSAIESKLDNTIIVDIDDIQTMLSAIESKIDLTVIPGISALESKLDILDLGAVDEMLSAIESKIDGATGIMQAISAVESKLDGGLFRSSYFLEGSSTVVDLGKTTATTIWADVNDSDITIKAFTISIIPGAYTGAMYYRVMADLAPAVKRFPFASSEIMPSDDYEAILDEMIYVRAGESAIIQVIHVGSAGASDIGTASAIVTSVKLMEWR